jgi:antitoxin component YwqK of YwqJK toxin-antitoxin module
MKYYLVIFSFFALSSCHNDINDATRRNEKWAWWTDAKSGKSRWIPLSKKPTWKNGKYTKFYADGKIFSMGAIKNGKNLDTIYFYDPKGFLYYYGSCESDSTEYYYIQEGYIKIFSSNGLVAGEGIISNHKISGKWTEYFRNGRPKVIDDITNDTGWITNFYERGGLKDSDYKVGNTAYPVKMWYENGELSLSATWKDYNYNGEYVEYYENRQIKGTIEMVNGQRNGVEKYWYESGKLRGIGNYKNGVIDGGQYMYFENGKELLFDHFVNGARDGEVQVFDENGNVVADRIYQGGVLIKLIK